MTASTIVGIISEVAKTTLQNSPLNAHLSYDLGIDSFHFLVVRERIEKEFGVKISDNELDEFSTIAGILDLVARKSQKPGVPARAEASKSEDPYDPDRASVDGSYVDGEKLITNLEIGMPLTGLNNLAETPLLKMIGNIRWRHISEYCKAPSKDIVDEDNERLYATFFYVDESFPRGRPMACYGENDRITIVSTLRRFGRSILDGEHYIFPSHWSKDRKVPPASAEEASANGVPYFQLSNIFVRQWKGAEWLKKSRPAMKGIENIPSVADAPTSYSAIKRASEDGKWGQNVFENSSRILPETMQDEYEIIPDRDLNGAGLLYFANYPIFLDICERKMLSTAENFTFSDDLLDLRSLVRRRSAYFSNANRRDKLVIYLQAWIENPFLSGADAPEESEIRLFLNYKMLRASDGRLMMYSSVEKTIHKTRLHQTELLEGLRREAKSQANSRTTL